VVTIYGVGVIPLVNYSGDYGVGVIPLVNYSGDYIWSRCHTFS
jgi:hypothetical protein